MYRYLLFILITTNICSLSAQDIYSPYSDVDDPKHIKKLEIKCYRDNFSEFINNYSEFTSLQNLKISDFENPYLPKSFYELEINTLVIENCPDLDFKIFFKSLSHNKHLKTLILDNNEIPVIPYELKEVNGLETLIIRNNEGIELEKSLESIKELPGLKKLGLSVNMLNDIPKNIGDIDQVEYLDISCNNLNDLPHNFQKLKDLDSLRIEENLLIDPINTVKKLKGINLKYLSMDGELSENDKETLKHLFPDLQIEYKKPENIIKIPEEEIAVSNIQQPYYIDTTKNFGTFKVKKVDFKAYSTAYLHYPRLFYSDRFKNNFDSTMYDERYLDTNYVGVAKRNPFTIYQTIYLRPRYTIFSKKVYFDFKNYVWVLDWYRLRSWDYCKSELSAFGNTVWIVRGSMKKREFRKKYGRKGKWVDMRVYFNEANKDFTIEMKHRGGFERFNAYPVFKNRKKELEKCQKQYVRMYSRYIGRLEMEKKRFHSQLFRDKKLHSRALKKAYNNTWKAFRKAYFSKEELKMTRQEWLEYYDKVISIEKKALYSSTASVDNLKRSLDLEKYYSSLPANASPDSTNAVEVTFTDQEGKILPVKKLLVINLTNRSYYSFQGNLGIDFQTLFLEKKVSVIFTEFRNGDIGYITQSELAKLDLNPDQQHEIPLKVISKDISSIGQFFELLGL